MKVFGYVIFTVLAVGYVQAAYGQVTPQEVSNYVQNLTTSSARLNYLNDPAHRLPTWNFYNLSLINQGNFILYKSASPEPPDRDEAFRTAQDYYRHLVNTHYRGFNTLEDFFENQKFLNSIPPRAAENFSAKVRYLSGFSTGITQGGLRLTFAPAILAGSGAPSTRTKAIRRLFDIVSPFPSDASDGAKVIINMSLPGLLEEVATNALYYRAASRLALTILSKGKNATPVSGNLWDDCNRAFLEAGAPPSQTATYSMKLLGLYGSRGVGWSQFFSNNPPLWFPFTTPIFTALGTIAVGISHLDSMTFNSGHPYSLPPEISSSANYARPYHFWYSAELARELAEIGHPAEDALEAVQRLGFMYELTANVTTNSPQQLVDNAMSSYVIETKEDIFFNGLGATWGLRKRAQPSSLLPLDANEQLFKIFKKWDSPEHERVSDVLRVNLLTAAGYLKGIPQEILAAANVLHPFTWMETWKSYIAQPAADSASSAKAVKASGNSNGLSKICELLKFL